MRKETTVGLFPVFEQFNTNCLIQFNLCVNYITFEMSESSFSHELEFFLELHLSV